MKNQYNKPTLRELADILCNKINSRSDCFQTIHIVFPNLKIQQWFKAYWLDTQKDAVLLNVSFETLDSVLPLITENRHKLISANNLRQIIINILSNDLVAIDQKYKDYYDNSSVKLYDFADSLTKLYLDYYKDNFEDIKGWDDPDNFERVLFNKIVEICDANRFGTIEKPQACASKINGLIYFFGFAKFEKIYRQLLDDINNDNVEELSLEEKPDVCPDYEIHTAPSALREVEWLHSKICDLLKNPDNRAIDFLVVSPNLSAYVNTIDRVFKQDDSNQKTREFPNIPYVINYREKKDTDVISALKILFKIYKTGYYTRLDFNDLINNPAIRKVRNISDDDIKNWMETIVNLKVYRQHNNVDDWDYLKKRLILSKVSSINFKEDNLVSLNDGDYLPYSNIGFDDESILRIVNVIDDITSFCNYLKTPATFNDFVNGLIEELDKWFKTEDCNDKVFREYKKVLLSLDNFKKHVAPSLNIDIDVLFYVLFNDGAISSTQLGKSFLDGITFVDYDVNTIVSAKYIFVLGASSNNLPKNNIKSELDLRTINKKSDDEKTFNLLKQNASEALLISYVNTDLKTEEEYYLSPIVNEFNKKLGQKYKVSGDDSTTGRIDIEMIPLDETRPYSELYTRREYKSREYYDNLLDPPSGQTSYQAQRVDNGPTAPVFRETITISEIKDYLSEPLSYKMKQLFGLNSHLQDNINDCYEPFGLDNLENAALEERIIISILKDPAGFDEKALLGELKTEHLLPTISEEYEELAFNETLEVCKDSCNKINDILNGGKLQIIEPGYISLLDKNQKSWQLISNKMCGLYEKGKTRTYFDFRRIKDKSEIYEFLSLYVLSLMDIAVQPDISAEEEPYRVILAKGETSEPPVDKFGPRPYALIEKITPQEARAVLNGIHDVVNDFSANKAIPLRAAKEKIDSLFVLKGALRGKQDGKGGAWSFFDHKRIITDEELGFDEDDLEDTQTFIDALNEQIKHIKYLREKKKEDDEKDGNKKQ